MEDLDEIYLFVAKRIKSARKNARLTQAQLGVLLSLSRPSIFNIENGRQRVLLHHLFAIAKATNVEMSYFFPATEGEELSMPAMLSGEESVKLARTVQKARKTLLAALSCLDEIP